MYMASLETNKSDSHLSEKQDFLHAESFGFSLVEFREKNGDDLRILFDMQNPEYMEERAGIDAVRSHEKMFHTLVMNEKMYMTD